MIEINAVDKVVDPFEARHETAASRSTQAGSGTASSEVSRSRRVLVATGRSGPLRSPLESILGIDERTRVLDTDLSPWRMVCALRLRGPNGSTAVGTGWFVGPRTLLTAGHCVYSASDFGGWIDSVEVIPGLNGSGSQALARPFTSATSTAVSSIDRWIEQADPDFDIGCIHLSEPIGTQVGWFALGTRGAEELAGFLVNISGYPVDRGRGSEQYHAVNRVLRVSDRRIFYEVDTFGGQSGAPVWIHEDADGPPVVVGIHAYGVGGTPASAGITANSAPRIIPEIFDTVVAWIASDDARAQVDP